MITSTAFAEVKENRARVSFTCDICGRKQSFHRTEDYGEPALFAGCMNAWKWVLCHECGETQTVFEDIKKEVR